MGIVKETGGARIGMANATWPFATLTVTKELLELNATILGKLVFKPVDIISIEPYSGFLSSGIKINHRIPTYKTNVIFWTFDTPIKLLKRIEQTGFLTNTNSVSSALEKQIITTQSGGGFPIKTRAAIAIVIIWNFLFLFDFQAFFRGNTTGFPLAIGSQLALGFVLLVCVLLLTSTSIRRIILKEGRTVGDIKRFVFFIMFICGFMLLSTILLHLKK